MKKRDDLVARYLDGALSERELAGLVDDLRGAPGLATEMRRHEALESLCEALASAAPPLPEGLVARVLARTRTIPEAPSPWWQPLLDAIANSPARAAAAALALLLLGAGAGLGLGATLLGGAPLPRPEGGAAPREKAPPAPDRVLVRFVLEAPSAKMVAVVGDFTRWEPRALALRGGVWTGALTLPRGRHEYLFVVDGERWVVDPAAEHVVEDGFGGYNAVLDL